MGNLIKSAIENPENEKVLLNLFKKFDKDKSGELDKSEFVCMANEFLKFFQKKEYKQNDELLEYIFNDCDVNNDAKISFNEFCKYLRGSDLFSI